MDNISHRYLSKDEFSLSAELLVLFLKQLALRSFTFKMGELVSMSFKVL